MGQLLCKSRSIRSILKGVYFHILPLWSKETFKHVCLNISFHKFVETSPNFDILWKLEFRIHFPCCPFCKTVQLWWKKSCDNVFQPFVRILDTKAAKHEFYFRRNSGRNYLVILIMLWGTKQCSSSAEVFISTSMSETRDSNAQNWCIRSWLRITSVVQCSPKNPEYCLNGLSKTVFWYLQSN